MSALEDSKLLEMWDTLEKGKRAQLHFAAYFAPEVPTNPDYVWKVLRLFFFFSVLYCNMELI